MRMPELKSLARECRLRNYSRMRKAELAVLLQNNPPPAPRTRPPRLTRPPPAPPPTQTWESIDDRKPRKPSSQEMDIFEQQEMSKSQPQVKTKLNKWYNWLINHVPKPIKDGASKAFKTFKVHIPPLTKFRPETPCGVKRSHAKNFRNRNCGFPTIKHF